MILPCRVHWKCSLLLVYAFQFRSSIIWYIPWACAPQMQDHIQEHHSQLVTKWDALLFPCFPWEGMFGPNQTSPSLILSNKWLWKSGCNFSTCSMGLKEKIQPMPPSAVLCTCFSITGSPHTQDRAQVVWRWGGTEGWRVFCWATSSALIVLDFQLRGTVKDNYHHGLPEITGLLSS